MMQTRELPPAEWPKLAGTELDDVWEMLDPACTKVAVVEQAGEVIGCISTVLTLNAHGLWIARAHRGKAGVFRQLRQGLTTIAHGYGTTAVMTSAVEPRMQTLLTRLGARPLDGMHYVLPLEVQ